MTRLGTAHTKTRYEVRGSAKKIRPQKGSGRARLGDKKSPMLVGGGVSHGPRNRDFSTELPKKVYDLAWRTALSYRWRKGELIIVDNAIELESPSRRLLSHIFEAHERERGKGRSLLVTSQNRPLLEHALDKMDRRRQALTWDLVDVKDLLELSRIIIERQALWKIFASHRSDLLSSPATDLGPEPKKPETHEFVAGWPQFRALVTAPPEQRDAVRAEAYESTAFQRWQHAESLPETDSQKLFLTASAFELLAEAKDLSRAQLATAASLEAAIEEAENKLAKTDPVTDEANIEHRRDAYRFTGEEELAVQQEDIAGDARTDVEMAEEQMLKTKMNLAQYKYDAVLSAEGSEQEANRYKADLGRLQKELDTLSERNAAAREAAAEGEVDAEELRMLEREEAQRAEAGKKP